jgi:hypothetical protein
MKWAIVNFTKIVPNSIIASNQMAVHLAQTLPDCEVIDRKTACNPNKKYDCVILINGAFGFCDFRDEVVQLCQNNDKFIWAGNDYAIKIPSQIKNHLHDLTYWCAYDMQGASNYRYVNWNSITYRPLGYYPPKMYGGLMYFGAYRQGREKYFAEYLGQQVQYEAYISGSSKRVAQKFLKLNPKAKIFEARPPELAQTLSPFSTTIYIEDVKMHQLYCSPSNRFYEALSAGVFILFDHNCLNTFKRAEIEIGDYLVNGHQEVGSKLKHWSELQQRQKKEFAERLADDNSFARDLASAISEVC